MDITLVSRGSPDMLSDLVADGLFRRLGRSHVHLALGKGGPNHHDPRHSPFFKEYDKENTVGFYDTDGIITSVRSGLQDIKEWTRRTSKSRVLVIDGEDDAVIRTDYLHSCRLYFKREYLSGVTYDKRIKPFPFGCIPEEMPPEKPVREGIFYKCRLNDQIRLTIANKLAGMGFDTGWNDIWQKWRYNEGLSQALIAISARGAGWDTYRYWEIPYFGACLLSQRPGIVIPQNLIDGQEAVYFDNPDHFCQRLKWLLDHRELAIQIAKNGRKACVERHLSTHRADTLIQALQ